jgi:hypothetical protein
MINNCIIFDGVTEFSNLEIIDNNQLRAFRNSTIALNGFASLIERINLENGLIYISTNASFTENRIELRNVSDDLMKDFLALYK